MTKSWFDGMNIAAMVGLGLMLSLVAGTVYAATPPDPPPPVMTTQSDRLEEENRARYAYNQRFDRVVVYPLIKGYRWIPEGIRLAISNALSNLGMPFIFANHVLQGNFTWAGQDVGRFAINSTIGFAGLFDVAAPIGLAKNGTDFGITLGVWGVPAGRYLILPALGPTNLRDTIGFATGIATPNPVKDALNLSSGANWSITGLNYLDIRDRLYDPMMMLEKTAVDPYSQMKSFYEQGREAAIRRARLGPASDDAAGKPGKPAWFMPTQAKPGQEKPGQEKPGGANPTQSLPGSGDPAWDREDKDRQGGGKTDE